MQREHHEKKGGKEKKRGEKNSKELWGCYELKKSFHNNVHAVIYVQKLICGLI